LPDQNVFTIVGQALSPDVESIPKVADTLDIVGHQDVATTFNRLVDQLEQDVVLVVDSVQVQG
jgi:hypothetical protein